MADHRPELRIDPVTGRKVLIAPGRAARPMTLAHAEPQHRTPRHRAAENLFCPFCPGSEWDTPNETYALRESGLQPNGPGWQLRVVPNKFPAVDVNGDGAFGIHEVVVPCPEHEANPVKLSDGQWSAMVLAWRDRLRAFARDERLAYAQVFQNVGAEAGASLDHVHAQILATPFVPDAIREELVGSETSFRKTGSCAFCAMRDEPSRLVYDDRDFTVLCPPAPRFGFESWIIPVQHNSHFESISDDDAGRLAVTLKRTLMAIDRVLHEPAYNFFLHTAPFRTTPLPHYHWHIEIIPRTARAAGYEWGAGVFINSVSPESAAEQLRVAVNY